MAISFRMLNADQVRKVILQRGTAGARILRDTLMEEATKAFSESQREVPHADGPLRNSGQIIPPKVTGDGRVEIVLGYGGAASAYAVRQHEDLGLRHPDPNNPKSSPSGKAKYLEDPMKRARDRIPGKLKSNLQRGA